VDGAPCSLWVYQDVTERKQTERELADAIEEVMKDINCLSHSILDKLATLRRLEVRVPAANLSSREREILELICDAWTTA
jgi:DNA-binding NarL/FixJ family response regulator